jgi:alpha-amylase
MRPIRFIFALHNHQPIGNFDHLFEQSYQDSYLPFLEVYSEYPAVKLTLHTSGCLMEWLDAHHPEYVDRLAEFVRQGRIEIVGGPFYEPILAMLPSRDRIGQIRKYSEWLQNRLGATIHGLWTPERVWEQSYVRDLTETGIRYTILDDTHFKNAGLSDQALWKHYITEDDGQTMFVFPGSERLRYLIPFRNIEELIDYFAWQAELNTEAVLVHADDGEKFGSWPNTSATVFGERWLHRFFQTLTDNADWIITTTPSEVIDHFAPLGTVYLPDGSYREMTEWVLSTENQHELARLTNELGQNENWKAVRRFLRGGFWRNFKVRYPESNEMYTKMMEVSGRANGRQQIAEILTHLYRAQCNCGYWHGAFGGVYLPHLRNSVYRELIEAEKILDQLEKGPASKVEAQVDDFNFDSFSEIKLANENLAVYVAPHSGGMMYELDFKSISQKLLATMSRREESYHALIHRVAADPNTVDVNGNRVTLKQEGLERRILYDWYPRKSLIDLFYDADTNFDAVQNGQVGQHGTFVTGNYESIIRKKPGRIQILLACDAAAYGAPIRIQKGITLSAGSNELGIAYRLENLPQEYKMHFAIELNFAGLPGGAEDRYFETKTPAETKRLGNLSSNLDLYEASNLSLIDEWLGVKVDFHPSRTTDIYAFPIESVNQSEGGFELVHQSVCVQPHWILEPESDGSWSVDFTLAFDRLPSV